MKFGMALSTFGSAKDLIVRARRIEELKFDTLWVADERFHLSVYSVLTLCGLNTDNIKIGTNVTDPYIMHPALTAREIATVDELSNNRAILGFGAGMSGFQQLGIKRKRPITAIREAVMIIRQLLKGEKVSFDGKTVSLNNLNLNFKTRHDIPIYIAGRGPKVLSLAGEVADGVTIGSLISRKASQYALNRISNGANKSGRNIKDIDINMWAHTAISKDGDKARRQLKPMIAYIIQSGRAMLKDIGIDEEEVKPVLEVLDRYKHDKLLARKLAADLVTNGLIEAFALAGSVDEVIEKISVLEKTGVTQISVSPKPLPSETRGDFIRHFSEDIMSHFHVNK